MPRRRPWWLFVCCVAAAGGALVSGVADAAPAPPFVGRYRLVPGTRANDLSPAGGIVDIDFRHVAYTANWRLGSARPLRGLGLSEGNDLLGVSLYTGGIAHGLAIYRKADGGRRWLGHWITSIDSAASVGVMDFDADPKQPTLAGKHHFTGHRASTGQFEGTVTMSPQGEDFLLAFTTSGGATLYRGVGILRGERLVVAWSFGSSPALAAYELGEHGELNGRRLSMRTRGALQPMPERLVPADAVVVASGSAGAAKEKDRRPDVGVMSASEPSAPSVKAISYSDLVARYGSAGWADRWLDGQLTSDEQRLLELAVRRHSAGDPTAATLGARTVAQLIEEQRRLQSP